MARPNLDRTLDSKTFRDFYYLKEELVDFCRKSGLSPSGSKAELTNRIAYFLETGKVLAEKQIKSKKAVNIDSITEDMKIEPDFVCSETHRVFFKQHIGDSFSFIVPFQRWLKSNTGRTYREAIVAYYQILEDKKKGKTKIDSQFEYNTYVRDFFSDNQGKTLDEAIKCWKYKKQLQGHNRYERSDLVALSRE